MPVACALRGHAFARAESVRRKPGVGTRRKSLLDMGKPVGTGERRVGRAIVGLTESLDEDSTYRTAAISDVCWRTVQPGVSR
jgi:hypothetical protein